MQFESYWPFKQQHIIYQICQQQIIVVIIFLKETMHQGQKILIKDPYLNSTFKSQSKGNTFLSVPKPETHTGQAGYDFNDNSKWKIESQMRRQLQNTRNQFQRMTRAYTEQNRLNKKILDFQAVNHEYHQALKMRNFDLNNRIVDLASQNHLLSNRFEGDIARNYHEKDLLVRKFEAQSEQLIQARKTINNLLEHKTKLQEELEHMTFLLDNQSTKFALEMKQQALRMESLERSIKNITQTKDQQINQLRGRLRNYEDENKRLNDENRSLHIFNSSQNQREKEKQNRAGLQNLSQIHHLDSQSKQNMSVNKQLQDQKAINDKLHKEIEDLKKKLFNDEAKQGNQKRSRGASPQNADFRKNKQVADQSPQKMQLDKIDGIINSINTLRGGITRQVFEVFYKSVKDGQKHRSNSLVIFIQNWKNIDLERIHPYIHSYLQSRQALKQICLSNKYSGRQIHEKMQTCIPLRIALKKGRNQINLWILSTIQLTKNQKESSKKSMNNLLLFLFRLLTIQYRIMYPMQGKSYTIDEDVQNQLSHEIVKAIDYIIEFN